MNAFTAKEYTCYYARVLDTDLPLAIDVVCDMLTGSLIDAEDVDAERGVILEEIAMTEDDPGDCVHDLFAHTMLGDTPLGRPVLGTVDTVNALTARPHPPLLQEALRPDPPGRRRRRQRRPRQGRTPGPRAPSSRPAPWTAPTPRRSPRAPAPAPSAPPAASSCSTARPSRPTSSSACPGLARTDDRRWALGVLNTALGGGMSSRLFQEVREKRGLAYSVYSYTSGFADCGLFGVYAGCRPEPGARRAEDLPRRTRPGRRARPHRRRDRPRHRPARAAPPSSAWRTPAR